MPGGELLGGDGREQRRVDLRPSAAEGDQGTIADPRNRAVLVAAGQEGCRVVVDGGCRAERGGRDQGPVRGEVVAAQSHTVAGPAEDVTGPDDHVVEPQFAPGPPRQALRGDQSAGQALPGVDGGGGELPE